ncbi:unnamed protein product [Dicrocoelium dendriticum]|nr:unnamed protein product [Dicrocoelium dendriticum]
MGEPLSLCILRPKPEPTETFSSTVSLKREEVATPLGPWKEKLNSKAQRTSKQSLKTEQKSSANPLGARCSPTIGAVASPVSRKDGRYYICGYCGDSFSRKLKYQNHVKSVHLKHRIYICGYCGKCCSRKSNLKVHEQSVHLNQQTRICERCGRSFTRCGAIQKHVRSVHLNLREHIYEYSESLDCNHGNQMLTVIEIHFLIALFYVAPTPAPTHYSIV